MTRTKPARTNRQKPDFRRLDDAQLAQVTGGDGDLTIATVDQEAHKSGSIVYLNRTRQKE